MTIEHLSNTNKQRSKPSDEQERSDDEIDIASKATKKKLTSNDNKNKNI